MCTVTIMCPVCEGEGVIPDPLSDGIVDTECPACGGDTWLEAELEDDNVR